MFELCTPQTHGVPDSQRDQQKTNKQTKKQTPRFRTYSRRALFDLPQTLHGDRAPRAHHKRCHLFFDLIHSFSARGQNVDFWLLSKNNTGRLPLRGILPVKKLEFKLLRFFRFYKNLKNRFLKPTFTALSICESQSRASFSSFYEISQKN